MPPLLPPEMWAEIVAYLGGSRRDLLSLTLVSKALNSEAERVLFHNITITRPEDRVSPNQGRTRLLQRILAPGPIASYIHHLQLNLTGLDYENLDLDHPQLLIALRKMSNLRNLQLIESQDSPGSILAEIAGTVPFRLECLETGADISFGLENFLRTQPSIRTLKWSGKPRRLRLPPKALEELETKFSSRELPNLGTLTLSFGEHLGIFLPRCSISHLQLDDLKLHEAMAVMPSVLSLQVNFLFMTTQSPLALLTAKFTSLEFLDLIWVGMPAAGDFKPFGSLVKLSLWDDNRPSKYDWDAAVEQWSEFARKILEGPSTAARWIDVTYRSMLNEDEKLLRVRRSANSSVIVAETFHVAFEELDKDWEYWDGLPDW